MNKESLERAKKIIIERYSTMDADLMDRIELMMNNLKFLEDYEENIRVLEEHRAKKKLILDNNEKK